MNTNQELTKNYKILLHPSCKAEELTAFGLRIGNEAIHLPKENIKVVYPLSYPYETTSKGNILYKIIDGITIVISEKEQFELTTKKDGWVSYTNWVGFDVRNGKIASISLYDVFETLEINHCDDITKKFGEPDEIERSRYGRTFYYFDKQLQVYWSGEQPDKYKEYSRVKIGSLDRKPTFYTAKDVLTQYLQLAYWEHDILKRKDFDKSEPDYYYRYTNFVALLKAFGLTATKNEFTERSRKNTTVITLGESEDLPLQNYIDKKITSPILYFSNGYFINHRPLQIYQFTFERMKAFAQKTKREQITSNDFHIFFTWLLRYRVNAQKSLDHLSGVLEASGAGCFLAAELITASNQFFSKELEQIEEFLCDMIDPENRAISQKDLVKNFGYLEINLKDIDLELAWYGEVPSWLVD